MDFTIVGTLLFGSLGVTAAIDGVQNKDARHKFFIGLLFLGAATFIAASRIYNYRYFQNIELPKLQAIANRK